MDAFSHQIDDEIKRRARLLSRYTALLRPILPPDCMPHFDVANVAQNIITIVADSPAWTSRIRQLGPEILRALNAMPEHHFHHVKVITRHGPRVDRHQEAPVKRQMSESAGDIIDQTASYVEDDELRDALKHLARHRRKD